MAALERCYPQDRFYFDGSSYWWRSGSGRKVDRSELVRTTEGGSYASHSGHHPASDHLVTSVKIRVRPRAIEVTRTLLGEVQWRIYENMPLFRACYRRALIDQPALRGQVVIRAWRYPNGTDGQVVGDHGSTATGEGLLCCMEASQPHPDWFVNVPWGTGAALRYRLRLTLEKKSPATT